MRTYIHLLPHWPNFFWNREQIAALLHDTQLRRQNLIDNRLASGFECSDTRSYASPLTAEKLFGWHVSLFNKDQQDLLIGGWRKNPANLPMKVFAGEGGKESVYFEAPASSRLPSEMKNFLAWFNDDNEPDPLIKAAIAHLWFVTIHPFDDGNGRIARIITDLQLSRANGTSRRFYNMNDQIKNSRKGYYNILAATQKGNLDITNWLQWFLECLSWAIYTAQKKNIRKLTVQA
jgi:prophage maintenance system killer protein